MSVMILRSAGHILLATQGMPVTFW